MKKLLLNVYVGLIEVLLLSSQLFGQAVTIISDWPDSYQPSVPVQFSILSDKHVERVYCNHRSAKTDDLSIISEYGEQEETQWTISLNENETVVRIRAFGKRKLMPLLDTICTIEYNKQGAIISIGTGSNTPENKGGVLPHSATDARIVFDKLKSSLDICFIDTILLNQCDANVENIIGSLNKIGERIPKGDGNVVFVYLSGHGERQKADRGFKFQVKSNEVCIDSVYIDRETIVDTLKYIAKKGAKVWVFVDACHSKNIYSHCNQEQFSDLNDGGILFFTARLNKEGKTSDGEYARALVEAIEQEKNKLFNTHVDALSLNKDIKRAIRRNVTSVNKENEINISDPRSFGNINNVAEERLFFKKTSNDYYRVWSPLLSVGIRGSLRNRYFDSIMRLGITKQLFKGSCDRIRCFAELQFTGENNDDYRFGSFLGNDFELRYVPTSMLFGGVGLGMEWNFYKLDIGFNVTGRVGRLQSEPVVYASATQNIITTETVVKEVPFMDITPSITFNPLTYFNSWKHFNVEIGYGIMFAKNNGEICYVKKQGLWKSLMLNLGYSFSFPSKKNHNGDR